MENAWLLFDMKENTTIAMFNTSNQFPLGRQQWVLTDPLLCSESDPGKMQMMLSSCGEDRYSCSDGTCVEIEKKCDYVMDCLDGSDEVMCDILDLETLKMNYDSNLPNIKVNSENKIVETPIKISIEIEKLTSIKEIEQTFSAKLQLVAVWFDPRVTWSDLSYDANLNILSQYQNEKLWIPTIIFKNTDNNLQTVIDNKAKVTVKKYGNYTKSSQYELIETAYYKGSENPLEYSREFHIAINCQFDLQIYPFDSQTCTILLGKESKVTNFIKLVPNVLTYKGPILLTQFAVIEWKMDPACPDSGYDIVIQIILKRRIAQHLLSTFLPSLCILTIAQVMLKVI